MSLDKLDLVLIENLRYLEKKGTLKGAEKVINALKPAQSGWGPRCYLAGYGNREFLRMNSNSYLGLSLHPAVIAAEEEASNAFGAGPGAVRFISGTCQYHIQLEKMLADFHGRPAGMIFSAAYAAIMAVIPQLIGSETIVLSDALNHNSIINAIRLARPKEKEVYRHLDCADLEAKLKSFVGRGERVLVVTDGVFSMRGDTAPLAELSALCRQYDNQFGQGVILVVDDSHGVGALGKSGRGGEEYSGGLADILVGTLGKAYGVNGGYVVADQIVIDYLRETAPFYIYSNPITPGEAAAAMAALSIIDSPEGLEMLARLRHLTGIFENILLELGHEIIAGEHPVVPLLTRDTAKTIELVDYLFEKGVWATGLKYPVVPKGEEEIRFQVSASHTEKDLDFVKSVLAAFPG